MPILFNNEKLPNTKENLFVQYLSETTITNKYERPMSYEEWLENKLKLALNKIHNYEESLKYLDDDWK
jgi:hypothetical protein